MCSLGMLLISVVDCTIPHFTTHRPNFHPNKQVLTKAISVVNDSILAFCHDLSYVFLNIGLIVYFCTTFNSNAVIMDWKFSCFLHFPSSWWMYKRKNLCDTYVNSKKKLQFKKVTRLPKARKKTWPYYRLSFHEFQCVDYTQNAWFWTFSYS